MKEDKRPYRYIFDEVVGDRNRCSVWTEKTDEVQVRAAMAAVQKFDAIDFISRLNGATGQAIKFSQTDEDVLALIEASKALAVTKMKPLKWSSEEVAGREKLKRFKSAIDTITELGPEYSRRKLHAGVNYYGSFGGD